MAKQAAHAPVQKKKSTARASLLTRLLILLLLAGIGWHLVNLREQVASAQAEKDALAQQVQTQQQTNDSISADIAAGDTQEVVEGIARDKLGLVSPGERVFYDVSN